MGPRAILLVLLFAALAGVIGGAPASDAPAQAVAGFVGAIPADEAFADPFPIRRVRAAEAHLPDLLKQLDPGPLVHLPRSEFESRVRAAGQRVAEARVLPRIADARFQAALVGSDLIGTAELDIVSSAAAPRFLPLEPLRLALGPATWADGREAVIGIPLGGTSTQVWVDRPGRQTLRISWSLAGVAELGEQRFDLRVPTAATATLTLQLPAGQVPAASASDVLLTGPFPGANEAQPAEWRFRFGGRPRMDFAVRPAVNPGALSAAALVARYDLAPGQLLAAFEYDLRLSRGGVGEWGFSVDPGLRITDVVLNNRAGWVIDPPTAPGGHRTLRVKLHQPGTGGKVLISAVAPLPDSARLSGAPLPGVRPMGAILDEETIDIRLAPGYQPANWHAGDYRLTDAQVLADQSRSLTLTGTLLAIGESRPFRRLPALGLTPAEVEFATAEQFAWSFDADHATITARINLRVRRGTLLQFSLHAPEGYGFVRATAEQEDFINHVETAAGTTMIEFSRPLGAGQSAELMFEFRGPSLAAARTFDFPAFVPVGAVERVGVLALFPGPLWNIDPVPGVGAHRAAWFDPEEPRIPSGAAAAYRYRAASPDGAVTISSIRAEFSAEATTAVAPLPGGLIGKTALGLRVRGGALASLLVVEAGGSAAQRAWRIAGSGNAVASAVVLPTTALLNPLLRPTGWPGRAAVGGADQLMGRVWLVRFARPVTGDISLESTATRTLPADATPEAIRTATDELSRWFVPGASPDPKSPHSTSPDPVKPSHASWQFSGLYLVTAVRSPSDVLVIFGGTIESSHGTSLPLHLPRGAELRAAGVGRQWLEPGACRVTDEGVVRLPVPGNGPTRFEVRYRLPAGIPTGLVRSPEPVLPGDGPESRPSSIQRWWVFAGDVLPGWPVRSWDRDNPADLPAFLGESPAAWAGGIVVSRIGLDEVRVGIARLADTIGLAVAVGIVLLVWAGVGHGRLLVAFSVGVLLLALAAVKFLGPPWWERAATIPVVVCLIGVAAVVVARGRRAMLPLAGGLFALVHLDTHGQSTAPAVVVIAPDADGREVVVAPKSVLDRLAAVPNAPGVVISASSYAIRVDDAGARIIAKYTAHALEDGDAVATLPLAEARLEKVLVNGSASYPAASRPGVYSVPLPGKGRHEVEVSFAAPVGGTGVERELRFGAPECPMARIAADLPGAARQAQVIGRIGRRNAVDGGRVKLEADLGVAKSVHLRWREGMEGKGTSTAVKVREGCVWDISEAGAELTACYLVRIEQGSLGSFQIHVPAELETLAVLVRSLDLSGAAALRDWTIGKEEGGYRPLRIDLQSPLTGQMLVVLTCAPRTAITRQPLLRFPKPAFPGGAGEPDAAYGLRTRGVSIEDPGRSGVIDYAPDALLRDFGGVIGRQDPEAPIRVFRSTPGGDPHLRPTIRVATEPPAATLQTTWTIGPRRADATGTIHWSGKDAPELLEFDLPGVRVLEVRGVDVASWSRSGSRVQVWFRRSARDGEVEWAGTMDVPAGPFAAVTPQVAELRLVSDSVRLRAAEGSTLTIERDRGWNPLETPGEPLARRTTSPDAPPVRVVIAPRTGRTN